MKQQHEKDTPFLTALFTYTVHWPMEAPAGLAEKYKDRPLKGFSHPGYPAMIEELDSCVGRILAGLDEMGIADNTFVVFTSDNGSYTGVADPRPLRADKAHLYEGGIRGP